MLRKMNQGTVYPLFRVLPCREIIEPIGNSPRRTFLHSRIRKRSAPRLAAEQVHGAAQQNGQQAQRDCYEAGLCRFALPGLISGKQKGRQILAALELF